MGDAVHSARFVRFGVFEIDLQAREVRKSGVRLKLTGQPFQVLAILLERPGEVVTREELQKRLWPDTFVDIEHNLNTAVNRIREVLGDAADNPRFVETLPRRGYRFIGPIQKNDPEINLQVVPSEKPEATLQQKSGRESRIVSYLVVSTIVCSLTVAGFIGYRKLHSPIPKQRALTRLTFDEGLQIGATWSPDARFIAYSSDRGGKFDIWVQQVSGGDPVQITKGPGNNWQPDWSPDGKYIAYRSENGEGGLFVIPALGGSGLERKIASFGFAPRWSPDSSRILFKTHFTDVDTSDTFYVVGLDGGEAREVAGDFVSQSDTHEKQALSAAWHPDGKRITLRTGLSRTIPSFWTLPVAGGLPVRTDIPTEIAKQLSDVSSEGQIEGAGDFKFCWNRAGTAIYFAPNFRGARNIWRLSIDPETLQATAIERVTTGPGLDSEFSLSPDGNRIAFTDQKRRVRAWVFPFNATSGRILGSGQALTSTSVDALRHNLSRDGSKLVFVGVRAGRWELMETLRATGRETLIIANDSYRRDGPQWSPDGTQLAYVRYKYSSGEGQLMVWSSLGHDEEPLTTIGKIDMLPYDWSPDGKSLLISQVNIKTGREEIWQVPVDARPHAESSSRRIVSDPSSDLYQGHFSPDGRWIAFESVRNPSHGLESALYVISATGGPSVEITDGKAWDDKPRWSPDGKTIYFVSGRGAIFNVWGVHFDPVRGKRQGQPFRVSDFTNPTHLIPRDYISVSELSLTQTQLVVTMADVSGDIWMLENSD